MIWLLVIMINVILNGFISNVWACLLHQLENGIVQIVLHNHVSILNIVLLSFPFFSLFNNNINYESKISIT